MLDNSQCCHQALATHVRSVACSVPSGHLASQLVLLQAAILPRRKLTYLNTGLGQVDLEGHFLPHEDVWVAGLAEQSF